MEKAVDLRRPRWGRRIGIAVGILVLLLVVIYFVATSSAFLKGVILPRASKSLNAQITVDDASISPFSEVILKNLRVKTTGADPLVRDEEHYLTFTNYLRRAFAGKGFLRLDRQDEWLARGFTRDRLAELTGWLASVEYEHADF